MPGLYLQKITTKEPDDRQLEVAIAAINAVRNDDPIGEKIISEKKEENPAGENQMQAAADAHSDESGQYGEYMVKPLKPALKRRRFI